MNLSFIERILFCWVTLGGGWEVSRIDEEGWTSLVDWVVRGGVVSMDSVVMLVDVVGRNGSGTSSNILLLLPEDEESVIIYDDKYFQPDT